MDIGIEPLAREYIEQSPLKIITLEAVERPGGLCSCGQCWQTPRNLSVRLGKPKRPENYEQRDIEGLLIYFKSSLRDSFRKIKVKVKKLLFIKYLVATGDK